jgi:hypothetical protein
MIYLCSLPNWPFTCFTGSPMSGPFEKKFMNFSFGPRKEARVSIRARMVAIQKFSKGLDILLRYFGCVSYIKITFTGNE